MPYQKANRAWRELRDFRSERERCKQYVFGTQPDCYEEGMSDGEMKAHYGQRPLRNNILRRIVRNVTGLYRARYKVPLATAYEYRTRKPKERLRKINDMRREVFLANRMEELLPRMLEEYLISGLAVAKIRMAGPLPDTESRRQVRITSVTPDNFFFHSDGYDPRGWDIDLIGEVHNLSPGNLIASFCTTPAELEQIERIYGISPATPCRVMEVWERTTQLTALIHDKRNAHLERLPAAEYLKTHISKNAAADVHVSITGTPSWVCSWFAADGTLLRRDAPAETHPYVMKAYPFIDGEIHSYISDLLDQQNYVNHLITLYDYIMRASAKGVLLIPDESIPQGIRPEEIAETWAKFNGVIPYRAVPGVPAPTQVSSNSTNIGITELLRIQMQLLEDISGVSPTLQGKLETANASGNLFARQNEAAVTSLLDVLRSFDSFTETIARRLQA